MVLVKVEEVETVTGTQSQAGLSIQEGESWMFFFHSSRAKPLNVLGGKNCLVSLNLTSARLI